MRWMKCGHDSSYLRGQPGEVAACEECERNERLYAEEAAADRAELERSTVALLERLLRGEHEYSTSFDAPERTRQADRVEKFEDDARALLAEWKAARP